MRTIIPSLLIAASLAAQTPQGNFAVRCGKLYTGAGAPIENAVLVVQNGRVQRVSTDGEPPESLPVIDASDKVVMPGIVAADTDLSGHADSPYTVTPDFVALDGFDYLRDYRRALSGGVTTAFLAPGRDRATPGAGSKRLIPGQGSIVKLFGDDIVERTLAERSCLCVTLGLASTQAPALFEPTPHPTADDPLLPARRQYPSSRLSQLATLRQLFHDAAAEEPNGVTGPGAPEERYATDAIRRVALGELPLRASVREAADVRRAVALARELGARLVLENPADVAPVAAHASESGVSAVFRMPINLSASNPGGEDRRKLDETRPRPENAGIAARSGMTVALAPNRTDDLADYLLVAGIAVRYGLDPEAAIAGITSAAAAVIGVDDRVGTLEPGKDADFLILSDDPMAIGTMVEKTFVSGRLAYERHTEIDLLAVRAATILTGDGRSIRDGVLLVQDGRIKGVGADLPVPYGARIVEVRDGIVVPGFIDGYTSLGLSGDGTGVLDGAPDQRVADVVRVGDPLFEPALRAGLTTLMVSGRDPSAGDRVAGRVAAIKPGARDRDGLVLRETAAVRFRFDAIDDPEVKAVKSQIDAGRKYIEAWQKYEKALADWKAGKGAKPKEAASPAETAPTADPISGTWECDVTDLPFPVDVSLVLELKLAGTTVTGRAVISIAPPGPGDLPPSEIQNGRFENGQLTLTTGFMRNEATLTAKIENDRLDGKLTGGPADATVTGERTSRAVGVVTTAAGGDDGEPTKPTVNESLEPIRAWIEKSIPAVIRTDRAPAIKRLVALLEKEQLPYVLHGVRDAIDTPELLGERPPNVMLGPELVRRDKGAVVNAAATLADRDAPLAIVSGDTAGSRYLTLHASHAIRYGMDPQAALRALTLGPAEMFGIDDRVGSLARGKDADFVVFSGSPFELTSRVMMVVAGGVIVVDERGGEDR